MNTIGVTMQKLQVNTKFVNNLQLEWSKFMIDVKLAKNMHESSFNQLYAYLRQHEAHANEVRFMRERFPGLLALVATTYNTPFSYTIPQTQYNSPQYHQQLSPMAQQYYLPPISVSPMVQHQSSLAPIANQPSVVHHQSYQAHVHHQQPQATFHQID
ncbi:hypothetical protein Tco_1441142 [Tanacetum coccineum]